MGDISRTGTVNGSIVLSGDYATLFGLITSDHTDAANVEAPAQGPIGASRTPSAGRIARAPGPNWAVAGPSLPPARR